MSDEDEARTGAPDEAGWEPSEYRFEEPWWFEALFSPWFAGVGTPVAVILVYVGYRLVAG